MSQEPPSRPVRSGAYPIVPLLEGTGIDADGPVGIGITIAGDGGWNENELEVFCKRTRIDPGETIELVISVSGVGRIDERDLSVFYESDDVIDLDDPGTVWRNRGSESAEREAMSVDSRPADHEPADVGSNAGAGSDAAAVANSDGNDDRVGDGSGEDDSDAGPGHRSPSEADASSSGDVAASAREGTKGGRPEGATSTPDEGDREPSHDAGNSMADADPMDGTALEWKSLEGPTTDDPFYLLELNTLETVSPGAYTLPVVFTFRSERGIKQVKKAPTVRVRSRRERWEPWITRAIVGISIAVALVALLSVAGLLSV
ncbi:hypothetical protein ACFQGT_05695 [Natrialbaceae archaeon GCM10025810]|uniref:hypothetical protein n=1 Tax=Halovalidus salilacus TaxID=3075124 RepID=UPI00360A2060